MNYPDSVWDLKVVRAKFGVGAVNEVGYEAIALGAKKALIITDKGVAGAGLVQGVTDSLKAQDIEFRVWDGVEPEPSLSSMREAISFAKDFEPDLFIAVGGGSSIDTAKVTNLVSTHGGDVVDYIAPPFGKGRKIPGPCRPLIAIPTTAGTGSETSSAAIISLPEERFKAGIVNDYLRPSLAILDPLLTVTMPPRITAHTGMDALTHAIEAYTVRSYDAKPKPRTPLDRPVYGGSNPFTDLLAARSIELIGSSLREAVYQGWSLKARSDMLLASFLAGVAFSNAGLGAVHAAAFPVGGRYHVPHGLACALLLPAVMEYNLPSNYVKFAEVAALLGEYVERMDVREAAELGIEAVKNLERDVGIPSGLSEIGITRTDIPELAEEAMKVKRMLMGNPRPITKEDMERIYENALKNY